MKKLIVCLLALASLNAFSYKIDATDTEIRRVAAEFKNYSSEFIGELRELEELYLIRCHGIHSDEGLEHILKGGKLRIIDFTQCSHLCEFRIFNSSLMTNLVSVNLSNCRQLQMVILESTCAMDQLISIDISSCFTLRYFQLLSTSTTPPFLNVQTLDFF